MRHIFCYQRHQLDSKPCWFYHSMCWTCATLFSTHIIWLYKVHLYLINAHFFSAWQSDILNYSNIHKNEFNLSTMILFNWPNPYFMYTSFLLGYGRIFLFFFYLGDMIKVLWKGRESWESQIPEQNQRHARPTQVDKGIPC